MNKGLSVSRILRRIGVGAIILLVLGYVAGVATLYMNQRDMLYAAGKEPPSPLALGLVDVQEVNIPTPDGETLAAWYRPANAGQPTVLYFHGKGGTMGHRHHQWQRYAAQGFGILFFDYRGFGASTGTPTEAGLKTDALAAYDWLRNKGVEARDIVAAAQSMGTGIAVITAAERKFAGLSLISGYSSIADVAAERYWFAPVHWLIHDTFDALPAANKLAMPVLQQHGDEDITIPLHFGQKLHAAIAGPKTFRLLRGFGHNDLGEEAFAAEIAFIASLPR